MIVNTLSGESDTEKPTNVEEAIALMITKPSVIRRPLIEMNGQPCPDSFLKGERFAFIKGHPKCLGTPHKFKRYGKSGTWMSDLIPNIAKHADDIAVVKSMWTDQFNHAPAELLLHTGNPIAGKASMGSWVTYGLGSESENLPGFVVLVSGGTDPTGGK